jgi:hypothetical protein
MSEVQRMVANIDRAETDTEQRDEAVKRTRRREDEKRWEESGRQPEAEVLFEMKYPRRHWPSRLSTCLGLQIAIGASPSLASM